MRPRNQHGDDVPTAVIERVIGPLAGALNPLLVESEWEASGFVRRLVDEWAAGTNRFERPGEALFAARLGDRLIGVCGLNVDPYAAAANVGRVRRLYVLTAYRRLGVGRQLVQAVLEASRGRFDVVRLRTTNPAAARLYESLGFRPSSDTADATHVLELGAPAPPIGRP
jgi:GNAT superfamily N-acetyltransferase